MSVSTPDKRKALGRGIDALLPSSRPNPIPSAPQTGVMEIEIDRIDANPYQTRATISQQTIDELAAIN
jgi:ParB family transcriptional regulator, chromosome partitioning protein